MLTSLDTDCFSFARSETLLNLYLDSDFRKLYICLYKPIDLGSSCGLLIIRYSNSLTFSKEELFSHPRLNKSLLIAIIVSLVYAVTTMLFNHKGLWINNKASVLLVIIKFFIVGFVEEMVFRGWGYNALTKVTTDKKAIYLSNACVILLHWPAYFIKFFRFGTFDLSGLLLQSLSALIWGISFCWLMKKGKTLWNSIIAHTVYDILLVLLVG